jgi:hypothetical protein
MRTLEGWDRQPIVIVADYGGELKTRIVKRVRATEAAPH